MTSKQLTKPERALTTTELLSFDDELKKFADLRDVLNNTYLGDNLDIGTLWSEKTLAHYRAIADQLPALRARWDGVNQRASADFIAREVAKLMTAFQNSGKDSDLFARLIADEVRAEQPTYYVLALAASAYRRNYRFLGISDLITEIKSARRKAAQVEDCIADVTEMQLTEQFNEIEAELPRMRKLIAERKRREKIGRDECEYGITINAAGEIVPDYPPDVADCEPHD
jgi:hypothetical protein